jgi:hypothetical protein
MRGGRLPRTLYLQLDNCIRENKNTVFMSYLCWLIERGIFVNIFLSFLPVGHTHFDCDALASRISLAMKYNNVLDIARLIELIKQCNSPSPAVEMIEAVSDVKGLFNPTQNSNFPVATSRVRFCAGCCTKVLPPPDHRFYMEMTSPLHWCIRKDLAGKVFVQSKLTCDDEQWSSAHYPWTPKAPRPDERMFKEGFSGLRPSDLRTAPQKFLPVTRAAELKKSMFHAKHRLSEEQWADVSKIYESLQEDSHLEFRDVPNDGLFVGELDDPGEQEAVHGEVAVQGLFLRPDSRVFENTHRQAIDRDNRKRRGRADAELIIGNLVAITVNYEERVPLKDRNQFWVGRITEVDQENRQICISYYNTTTKKNVTSNRSQYRAWVGQHRMDVISISRVLCTFAKFTDTMLIVAHTRRQIGDALQLPMDSDVSTEAHNSEMDNDEGEGGNN